MSHQLPPRNSFICRVSQRVQNAAARLIFELSPSEHITPSLLQLHWLPIRWRVQFKLCCFMYAVVTERCPAYLGSIVQPAIHSRVPVCDRHLPTSLYRGQGPSSASGPSLLPARLRGTHCHMCETVDSASFRKLLKTHYFTSAFGVV